MYRNVICLVFCFVVLCAINPVSGAILGHWRLDEGTGAVVEDASGNGNHGDIEGAEWVKGKSKSALLFDGVDDRVVIPDSATLHPATGDITLAAWIKVASDPSGWAIAGSIIHKNNGYQWAVQPTGTLWLGIWGARLETTGNYSFIDHVDEWHHVVATFTVATNSARIYVDGELNSQGTASATIDPTTAVVYLGHKQDGGGYFNGIIDEALIDDTPYTQDEIVALMKTDDELSSDPRPGEEATDVLRDVVLSWTSGELADTHTVFFGKVAEDVNYASAADPMGVLVSSKQNATTYDPDGLLDFGQTYYWRVDEVNAAPDFTAFKGSLWSFTVEPMGVPVESIVATASGFNPGMEPSKTVDDSGMNEADQHSVLGLDMWLTQTDGSWIQYEFDKAYKLHEMLVWNSNQIVETFIGFGIKDVVVETSLDGEVWTVIVGVPSFAKGSGLPTYQANTTIDLSGIVAQYVRITPQSTHGFTGQSGLSEVRFLAIPTSPRELVPTDGSATDGAEVSLNWRAGREAATHEIYLGIDQADLVLVSTSDESAFVTDPLNYGQTYYWQAVEVNEAETPARYASEVQRFDTPAYGTVDDFESYSGDEGQEVFLAWLDGFGGDASLGGSTTGHIDSPFVETTVVKSGGKSMPIFYDNNGGFLNIDGQTSSPAFSEVMREFDSPQDWGASGIKTLSLFFQGETTNAGQLYIKINGTRIDYDGDPMDIEQAQWHAWNIDLTSMGNLSSVRTLAIGIDGAGSGILYIDDIRLYPQLGEVITPIEPDASNLIAHYAFDGNANDSSGGLHGTVVGVPTFVPGKVGQALSLNTVLVTDYVEITGYQGILGANPITVAAWINTTSDATGAIMGWGPNVAGQRFGFRVDVGRLRFEHQGGNVQGDSLVNNGEWHHVAITVQANSTVSYPDVQLWLNGLDDTRDTTDPDAFNLTADLDVRIGNRPSADDRFFIGQIDETRIYDRALSAAEIAALAGRTADIHKPF